MKKKREKRDPFDTDPVLRMLRKNCRSVEQRLLRADPGASLTNLSEETWVFVAQVRSGNLRRREKKCRGYDEAYRLAQVFAEHWGVRVNFFPFSQEEQRASGCEDSRGEG